MCELKIFNFGLIGSIDACFNIFLKYYEEENIFYQYIAHKNEILYVKEVTISRAVPLLL